MSSKSGALERAFGAASPEHFEWQTSCPFVADRERELCQRAFLPLGERVLDLGCGEGATLVHLGAPAGAVGVDLFEDKLVFARRRLPDCVFVKASADSLPFPDGSFDHAIVRDVIHHIEEPAGAMDEIHRVLRSGGRVDVLEPCGRNPLIALHALTHVEERGELRSTMSFLVELLSRRFEIVNTRRAQALPIHRLVFHPRMGSPALATRRTVRNAVERAETLAEKLLPSWCWAYLHVRALRP